MRRLSALLVSLFLVIGCGGDPDDMDSDGTGGGGGSGGNGASVEDCEEVFEGDVVIEEESDLAQLSGICAITGDLIITKTTLSSIQLTLLEQVAGQIEIDDNTELEEIELPQLVTVGGIGVRRNEQLASLLLPKLLESEGELALDEDPVLEEIDLPLLGRVGGLGVRRNAKLEILLLPQLSESEGAVGGRSAFSGDGGRRSRHHGQRSAGIPEPATVGDGGRQYRLRK